MVVTTPSTVMPLPICDKKLAIKERVGNHNLFMYSQTITGPWRPPVIGRACSVIRRISWIFIICMANEHQFGSERI